MTTSTSLPPSEHANETRDARDARALGLWPSGASLAFLLSMLVAGRVVTDGGMRTAFLVAGGVFVIAAIGARARALWSATGAVRKLTLRALVALLMMVAGAGLSFGILADGPTAGALQAFGVLLALAGAVTTAMLELLAAQVRITGVVDVARVRAAWRTGITLVAACGALCAFVFGVQKDDVRWDLAYAAPTSPSGATLALVDTASCGADKSRPEIVLFFERGSTALAELQDYFASVATHGVNVRTLDQAIDPALSKAMKATKNGTIAVRCGERSESYVVGNERDDAQRKLPKLDEELRTRLGKVTRDPQTIYFTSGHGERPVDETDKQGRAAGKSLKRLLDAQNARNKRLGLADGLSAGVPADASLVVVFGPTQPFLAEETAALKRYAEAGGALWLLLDPPAADAADVQGSLRPLLDALGVSVGTARLRNDKEFVRETYTDADQAFLFSTSFGAHKSVKSLSQARGKAALLFRDATSVGKRTGDAGSDAGSAQPKVAIIARSRPATWVDVDDDHKPGAAEKRDVFDLAAAIETSAPGQARELRAIVVGDADVVGDLALQNEANAVFAYEIVQWLLRDDASTSGAVVVTDDVPIRHTRSEDTAWFYGTTVGVPALLLAIGFTFLGVKRRRHAR